MDKIYLVPHNNKLFKSSGVIQMILQMMLHDFCFLSTQLFTIIRDKSNMSLAVSQWLTDEPPAHLQFLAWSLSEPEWTVWPPVDWTLLHQMRREGLAVSGPVATAPILTEPEITTLTNFQAGLLPHNRCCNLGELIMKGF
jgi:hypothetical protein